MHMQAVLAVVLLGLVVTAWASGLAEQLHPEEIAGSIRAAGPFGPVLFVVAFALGELIHLPAVLFIFTAALIWPLPSALVTAYVGTVGAALFVVFVARFALGDLARRHLLHRLPARLRGLDQRLAEKGLREIIALRLILFMLPAAHWVLGVSRARTRDVVIGPRSPFPASSSASRATAWGDREAWRALFSACRGDRAAHLLRPPAPRQARSRHPRRHRPARARVSPLRDRRPRRRSSGGSGPPRPAPARDLASRPCRGGGRCRRRRAVRAGRRRRHRHAAGAGDAASPAGRRPRLARRRPLRRRQRGPRARPGESSRPRPPGDRARFAARGARDRARRRRPRQDRPRRGHPCRRAPRAARGGGHLDQRSQAAKRPFTRGVSRVRLKRSPAFRIASACVG